MIGGKEKPKLDLKTILMKISEYDVFRFYLGRDFELGTRINSPFRKDDNPSFCITKKDSGYKFIDFGNDEYRGGVVDFVRMLHPGLDFNGALEKIDRDMCLGIRHAPERDYRKIIKDYAKPCCEEEKPCKLRLIPRAFTNEELAYWNEYHQSEDDLKRLKIHSIGKMFMNGKRVSFNPSELRFAYEFGEDIYKVYRPFPKKKEDKFFPNNTRITDADVTEELEESDNVESIFVAKSRKDFAVVSKVFPYVIGVQNEGIGCFGEWRVVWINGKARLVWIGFDSDSPGKMASFRVTSKFGWRHINVPDIYLAEGIKDFADFGRIKGLKAIEDHFKLKGLIK